MADQEATGPGGHSADPGTSRTPRPGRPRGDHRLGWLGTGRMGQELVRRLLAAGCDVSVYNRTPAKAQPLSELGAKVVDSASDLASCDIVFTCVGTPQDLTDAVLGQGGLMAATAMPS